VATPGAESAVYDWLVVVVVVATRVPADVLVGRVRAHIDCTQWRQTCRHCLSALRLQVSVTPRLQHSRDLPSTPSDNL